MFEFTAALIGCALGAASDPDFAAIWYREVMEGEIEEAGDLYERLYLSPPFEGPSLDIRERAAFRAGLCFERLGRIDRALGAYEWIVERAGGPEALDAALSRGLAKDSLAASALRRIRKLPDTASSDVPPVEMSVLEEMERFLQQQRRRLRRLSDRAGELRELVGRREQNQRFVEELCERFRRSGCPLRFSHVEPTAEASVRALEQLFRVGDDQEVRIHAPLGLHFLQSAFRSCLGGDVTAARRELEMESLLVDDEHVTLLRSQFESLARSGLSRDQIARVGERLLLDTLSAERLRLRTGIETPLRESQRFAQRGRDDLAIAELAKVFNLLEWVLPAVREDREIEELEESCSRTLLRLGREAVPEEVIAELWSQRRELSEEVLSLAVRAVELAYAQVQVQGPALSEDPERARAHATREFQYDLLEARRHHAQGERANAEGALERARLLLSWFPRIDARGVLRAELETVADTVRTSQASRVKTQ